MTSDEIIRDLQLRVRALEMAMLKKGSPPEPGPIGNVDKMIRDKEYDRTIEEMRLIRSTYGDHQTWLSADKGRYLKLKARRDELRKLLGIVV